LPEAQADFAPWSFPVGPLGELTTRAHAAVEAARGDLAALEAAVAVAPSVPGFAAALRRPDIAVIAELKKKSPSKGDINAGLDVNARAAEYIGAGASALSVLTEPTRFGGSLEDLRAVRAALAGALNAPLLRKDFIVDRIQLLQARAAGASAALLIARALAPGRLEALAREARAIGLEVLLEVRDEDELSRALTVEHAVIGVNNRNLETLVIDDAVSARLLPRIPRERLAVFESGVTDRAGVERAARCGADAVLVGSALSASADGAAAVRALVGVPRQPRG
jgi:indole-3-glycerol phosphate synthase